MMFASARTGRSTHPMRGKIFTSIYLLWDQHQRLVPPRLLGLTLVDRLEDPVNQEINLLKEFVNLCEYYDSKSNCFTHKVAIVRSYQVQLLYV